LKVQLRWLPEIFSQPADYTLGNAPRTVTSVRTAGTRNVTMSLFKQFSLARYREGMRFEFRLEAFNAFNHPQFDAPDTAVGSSTFGKIFNTANHAREAQVALKFYSSTEDSTYSFVPGTIGLTNRSRHFSQTFLAEALLCASSQQSGV
jgi:hypothetical protein